MDDFAIKYQDFLNNLDDELGRQRLDRKCSLDDWLWCGGFTSWHGLIITRPVVLFAASALSFGSVNKPGFITMIRQLMNRRGPENKMRMDVLLNRAHVPFKARAAVDLFVSDVWRQMRHISKNEESQPSWPDLRTSVKMKFEFRKM